MVEKQNINIPLITCIGFVSMGLLFVIIVGVEAWFYSEVDDARGQRHVGQTNWALTEHDMTQREKLKEYRIVDQEKQRVAIPINEAIKLTAKKYAPAQP